MELTDYLHWAKSEARLCQVSLADFREANDDPAIDAWSAACEADAKALADRIKAKCAELESWRRTDE